jgi:methionine synthase I (cobalamin-dependent)/5,10-methylenetetrahydrofolate reductase
MDIRSHLAQGRPLLFDGAMGTCFAALPGRAAERCESANLDHPEEILSIHRAYLAAGCQAVKTNTFSVGVDLAQGDDDLAHRLIEEGSRLALEAAEPYGVPVFADLGPAPQSQEFGPAQVYLRQADLFLDQGLTHFLIETLPSDEGVAELARHLKGRCPAAFLIVSFAVGPDGATREGRLGRELLLRTAALPEVDAVGYNCVSGPSHMLRQIEGLNLGDTFLSAMPNAGYPTVLGRRTVYQGTPDYFAQRLEQLVQAGAAIVGGCCGTTPEHIARTAATLARTAVRHPGARPGQPRPRRAPSKSALWDKLDGGKRVVAVELDPPVDDDAAPFLDGVRTLRDAGVDAITIADCPVGRPRADSSLLACKLKRELGVEPLPHLTCRDRNLNATKALLLGLSMEGVHNILLVTGDPIPSTDRDEVKSVFNFNSRKLARYTSSLSEGTLATPFRIFGALNLNARNFDVQLRLAQEKEECGVSGFLTQPVLSPEALENLKRARAALKGKILGGVFPVVSHKNALFLNNEVAGIHVCDEILSLYEGKSREEGEDLAVRISARIAREIAPYTDGLYLMTPFRRVHLITRILQSIQ